MIVVEDSPARVAPLEIKAYHPVVLPRVCWRLFGAGSRLEVSLLHRNLTLADGQIPLRLFQRAAAGRPQPFGYATAPG